MSTMPERIIEVRKSAGLSQTDFGALGGVGKHTQINYEKGESYPDVRYLIGIANAGYDVSYIMFGRRGLYVDEVPKVACDPAVYMTPGAAIAGEIGKMQLSETDAQMVLALARRLSSA